MTAQIKTQNTIVTFAPAQDEFESNSINLRVDENEWTNLEVGFEVDLFLADGKLYVEYDPTGCEDDFISLEFDYDSIPANTQSVILDLVQR